MFGYISLMNVRNILPKKVRRGTSCICTHICTIPVQILASGIRQTLRSLHLKVDEGLYCLTHKSPEVTTVGTNHLLQQVRAHTLPTDAMYVLCTFLTISTRYFPTRHSLTGLHIVDGIFMWSRR